MKHDLIRGDCLSEAENEQVQVLRLPIRYKEWEDQEGWLVGCYTHHEEQGDTEVAGTLSGALVMTGQYMERAKAAVA